MAFIPHDNNLGVLRGLIEAGQSNIEIANHLGCTKKTPFDTLRNVHARLGIPGNIHTLSRAIRSRTDMRFRKPAKKPLLRDQDYALRLAYAYAHLERTPLDWRKTVFMDEKTFSSTKDGRLGVWRPIGGRFEQVNVKENSISGRHLMAFYDWMSGDGVGGLVEVDRRLNADQYVDILGTHLYPALLERYPLEEEIYIVEDNSPIHTAGVVQNLWSQLTRNWLPQDILTKAAIRAKLNDSWNIMIDQPYYCYNLATSMTRRLEEVIARNGAHTKY
ncbi:hypothetical protein TKK_0008788 [Trichogramma kaykai]